jgi:hypothetical protein
VGILVRYMAPAAAGTAFAYSVERRADKAFFDFELGVFRPLGAIPTGAITRPLTYHDAESVADHFEQADDSAAYIFRVYDFSRGGKLVAKLPVPAGSAVGRRSNVEPSYRTGKKFIGNKAIDARYRLTVYGDDGFTVHTATLWEDGTSSCNCPRWGPKVDGKRQCKHSVRALTLTANIDETGDQPEPPAPKVQPATNPFRRRSRPVDT